MEIIHISPDGDSYRLVFSSESSLRYFANGHTRLRNSRLEKYWPRVTRLKMYVNEKLAEQTKATQDSRDSDNKDYAMWVCLKKMLMYTQTSEFISKEDRKRIWDEFFISTTVLTPTNKH